MSQKRIPGRRARPGFAAHERPTVTGPYKRKRVRAGSSASKVRGKIGPIVAQSGPDAGSQAASPAPELSERQRRHLRGLAHDLKPIIRLGNAGLTDAVATETARALHDHELVKVKAPGGDREARDALFNELAQRTSSALVHRIGNVAVLYRPHAKLPRILIPDGG
jgi:RNA-binding protein